MINRSEIVIESKFGNRIHYMYLTHSERANSIAVLFPGGDNSTDVPTLHYARKASLLSGCDVLSLEYGCRIGYSTLSQPEILNTVIEECYNAIYECLKKGYKNIFFISKSIGHTVSFRLDSRLKDNIMKHICYTPISVHVPDIIKRKCIVFTGTKDKWFNKQDVCKLMEYPNVEMVRIENAVHSLEIDDDYKESVRILERVTDKCAEYIQKNTTSEAELIGEPLTTESQNINKLRLVTPTIDLKTEYLDMLDDWKKSGENLVPWVLKVDPSDFSAMVQRFIDCSKGIGVQEGYVEHSTYWLVNSQNKVLGAVNIRHRLNEHLLNIGGHIGYGIRPSERRKGYATEMLRLALQITKNLEIEKVLVTCDKDNIGSAKTIIKNGGILESEDIDDGVVFQRYWIGIT